MALYLDNLEQASPPTSGFLKAGKHLTFCRILTPLQ
jgi:hypothetical protein